MDVQHHPHVAKKKLKEYFLEFLMIFLAVTLGFFAEQVREGFVERRQQKEYIKSFYEDLKTDTLRITTYFNFDESKLRVLGNLNDCYQLISKNIKSTSCLLDIIKISAFNRPFKITGRTLNQLSNAGGFRILIKSDGDSIINYQNEYSSFDDFQTTVFQEAQDQVRATFDQLINFSANAQMFKPNGSRIELNFDNKTVTEPLLSANNPALLNKYFNELLLYYRATYNHQQRMLELKEQQVRLIEYFKKKYNLE